MFRFSIDEYIASEQMKEASSLIEGIGKKCIIKLSPEIEKAMTDYQIDSYESLQGIHDVALSQNDKIVIAATRRDNSADSAQWDLKRGFDEINKSWQDTIPYIEHSFDENYIYQNRDMKHVFIFFFTPYHEYEASCECVIHYIRKFNNLKAFL